jgi:hypothetical protein
MTTKGHSHAWAMAPPAKWFCAYRWHVGIRPRRHLAPGKEGAEGFTLLEAPYGHFYGDPFVVEHEGRVFLFVEDYSYLRRMARLVCCELDGSGNVLETRPVVEPPYHVSYPQVFEVDGTYYMIPETAAARRLELYRAVRFPWEWQLERFLLSGVMLHDPTHAIIGGRHWIFAGGSSAGQRGQYDQLHLFHAPTIHDSFQPHPRNPVKTDQASTRPAGSVIVDGEHLIRPAQDCSRWYGCGLNFMQVDLIDESGYAEHSLGSPPDSWLVEGYMGPHTYNFSEHFEVIDMASYGFVASAILGRSLSVVPKLAARSKSGRPRAINVECARDGR